MIELRLTDEEGRKLSALLDTLRKLGSKEPNLARVHHKLRTALRSRPIKQKAVEAVKRAMAQMEGENE